MSRRSLGTTRHSYLCTYDVAEDKRRNRLFELLKDHGEHVQYSVFLCELTVRECAGLIARSREIVHHEMDQLLVIKLGPAGLDWTQCLDSVGKSWTPFLRCTIV